MVEMATVGGLPKDQISKYQNMFTEVCGMWYGTIPLAFS